MYFYEWLVVGYSYNRWINHVFISSFHAQDRFTSLCGERFGALNAENKSEEYCPICTKLAPIAEEKSQVKERARIKKLELRRPDTLQKINGIINEMPIDKLLGLLRSLK